ncbi:MAG TPA: NAD(P)H-dependent oxidoreductase [Gemmatimonadaceae bacterium]|nr:NAD(P)H-dependent oxidoreductase [Gemmatimonadaceae bacterium]
MAERFGQADAHTATTLRVVAIAGSLRRSSYNRALIRAAEELAPEGMSIELIEIGQLPFFDADVEAEGDAPAVTAFKASVGRADGLLIATPEYNDGIPGVLTNAIDWGSRLPGSAPLTGKPVALIGASPSQIGTARAQLHLRQLLSHVHARTLPSPELLVANAHDKFDAELRLTNDRTRQVLAALLARFGRWIIRERAAAEVERSLTLSPAARS